MNPTTPTTPGVTQPAGPASATTKKRWLVPTTIVLVVIALAVGAWMMLSGMKSAAVAETPTAAVTITDNGFTPATIQIQKGQDVTWTNQSHSPVQIVGDLKSTGLQTSQALKPGDSYSFTFDDSGTFNYHDPSNLNHKGVVIAE